MSRNTFDKSSNAFITVLSLGIMAVLTVVVLTDKNLSLDSRAGKGPKETVFGKIVNSNEFRCKNITNKYSYITKDSMECNPLLVSEILVKEKLGKDVKLDGVLKDGVFYAVDVSLVASSPKPSMIPEKYKRTIPNPRMTPASE